MNNKVYQIQIAITGIKPKIWRRILIQPDLLLSDFHMVIQTTMGWTNSHLHQFIKNRAFYTCRMLGDELWDEMDNIDYKDMTISDLLNKEKEKIVYVYDYGDCWEHEIILEKILPSDIKTYYPMCLSGKKKCPPEDCGGVWGFTEMLDVLKQPDHEEYDTYVEWLGAKFDPDFFNKNEINEALKQSDFSCM